MIELIKVFLCTTKNLLNSERDLITTQGIGLDPEFSLTHLRNSAWTKVKGGGNRLGSQSSRAPTFISVSQ
jgi:hypothetical protein